MNQDTEANDSRVLGLLREKLERESVGIELWLPADEWEEGKAEGRSFADWLQERIAVA